MKYFAFLPLLLLASYCYAQNTISVDGDLSEKAWEGVETQQLSNGAKIQILIEDSILYVGLKGSSAGWSHVYLQNKDTIRILHASAALGSSTYVIENGSWKNNSCYNWELRESDINDETTAKMESYFTANGWVANNNAMTRTFSIEYKIDLNRFGPGEIRFATLYTTSAMSPPIYPAGIYDATTAEQIVYGNCPDEAGFSPENWILIER